MGGVTAYCQAPEWHVPVWRGGFHIIRHDPRIDHRNSKETISNVPSYTSLSVKLI